MAVSFKVPSSPAKSIFEIDEFLGVDLTNSGTNIDEHRSPNAPNMVRHVPGKVRKRTGYQTDTVFGNGLNTNLAIGADENEREFEISTSEETIIYDLFMRLGVTEENKPLYLEFDYMTDAEIWMTGVGRLSASPDEYTHVEGLYYIQGKYTINYIRAKGYGDSPTQSLKIKRLSAMYKQDENYKWTKAPKSFVYRETNDPIYGCHTIKHGTFDGNRVVNVNRALQTSSEFKSISVTSSFQSIYELGETQAPGRKVYLDFDYTLANNPIWIWANGSAKKLEVTEDELHASYEIITNDTYGYYNIQVMVASGTTATFNVKNLTLTYEKNDDYKWSAAPEDSGEEFHIEDTFLIEPKNIATVNEFTHSSTSGTGTYIAYSHDIYDGSEGKTGYFHVSFNIHTAITLGELSRIRVGLIASDNNLAWHQDFTSNLKGKQFDLFVASIYADKYIKGIYLEFTKKGEVILGGNMKVSNIVMNHATPSRYYDISSKYYIYHVGNDLFLKKNHGDAFEKIYSDANRAISTAWQMGDALYILDGKEIYSYTVGDSGVVPIGDGKGYIPTVTINKDPGGGGIPYEPINMLQPGFYETFYVSSKDPEARLFYLSFGDLDDTTVKVWVLNENAEWVEKTEHVDFEANRASGVVAFHDDKLPGVSPLTGEDNIKVLAYRTVAGYKERVTKCTIGTLFGVNGASDRLFLSGNPDYPNWDFYSEQYDPTYFPDTGYSSLGLSSSAIVGYAIVNNYLATFKDEYEPSQSVFIREGDLVTDPDTKLSNPAFKLINTLQGNGVIAPHSFGYLQTEPLFLTRSGVYAITAQDITGEKYSQNRSFFLNGELTKEKDLENAYAVVYNDMYILSINGKLYILDGLQPIQTDRSAPYSTRQYVGFYCTDIPAVCMWTDEQALWFGTPDGRVCSFATDIEALESYNDNGEPIYCCWETPDLDGKLFYKNKSFRYIAIRMMAALRTSVALWSMARGAWSFIKEDNNTGIFFDFENIDFEAFSFSTDRSDKVAHSKIRVKKVDKARFKIENGKLNEPFGLMNLALEYVESGNYKG